MSSESNVVDMEIEVVYTRTEKIRFEVNLDEGFGTTGVPYPVARLLRQMGYQMHSHKDLVKGEHPSIKGWRIVPSPEMCNYCLGGNPCKDHPGEEISK